MNTHSLNDLYHEYSQGVLKKKQFEELLFHAILENLENYNIYNWKRDDCLDFLSWLYPRISRSIDTYQKNEATFESYLCALIRWSAREYRTRYIYRDSTEHAVWMARFSDMYAHENEPDYYEESDENNQNFCNDSLKNPRQLLILILKCYCYLSDDFLDRLAPRVGIEKARLRQMVDCLRQQRIQRDETVRHMRERIHSQFYRCMVYEKKLKDAPENSNTYLKLTVQLEKSRQRLDTMRKRLAKIRLEATNLQIAQVLGISKGTVDSNLHALKNKPKDTAELPPRSRNMIQP